MAGIPDRVDSPFRKPPQSKEPAASTSPTPAPPEGSERLPRSRDEELQLRSLTGWEEEYIERHLDEVNTARVCNEVLARCLVPPGQEAGKAREQVARLLVAERDRALLGLRRRSLGDRVEARVQCSSCDEAFELEFSLADLPTDFVSPEGRLELHSSDGTPVMLRLPNAEDQALLFDQRLELEAERRSWLLGRLIERYGDRTEGFDADFARGLSVSDRRMLEAEVEAALPDFELGMGASCPSCSASFTVPFDISAFFLRS